MGNETDVVFCLQTLRNVVFETSLGNLTAANVSADSPLTGTGRGKAAWPYLVRIAPGGKVSARTRGIKYRSRRPPAIEPPRRSSITIKIKTSAAALTEKLLTRIKVTVKVTV